MSEVLAVVGLGANLGDRRATLERAVASLRASGATEVRAVSPWLDNPAVGGPPGQPDFLNGVALVATALAPEALLLLLQRIERENGRDRAREVANGPRTLDLDLLLYGDREVRTPALRVPHPRMLEREFVLAPLASVAPDLVLPQTGRSARDEARRLARRSGAGTDLAAASADG